MERANGKGNSMKTESQISHCLRECKLNSENSFDLENPTELPDRDKYINQGWVECLEWVLKSRPTMTVTPYLQVKVE